MTFIRPARSIYGRFGVWGFGFAALGIFGTAHRLKVVNFA